MLIGYPLNMAYDYSAVSGSINKQLNNVGCPFAGSSVKINTKPTERQVLSFFADLWGVSNDNVWGYLTSSGTEGNMQGLYVGREKLMSGGSNDVVLYTTKESHYSIFKIARILQLQTCVVETQECGEMDYKDFESKLLSNYDKKVLINANLGTTMKGAIDDTRKIYRIIKKYKKENDYYLHVDGALMGFVLPFIENDLFFKTHIHSISISGHKFLGIPFPCGVFLMEKRFLSDISNHIEYIGSIDCTISGSRNGHSPLFFKHIIDQKGHDGFKTDVERCIEHADYLAENLPGGWRNQNSITVVFPKPSDFVVDKWQLAVQGDIAHVVVMCHVTKEIIDKFINDYVSTQGRQLLLLEV